MSPRGFLLLNMALAFYNVGIIWAHEVDIFRSWRLVEASTFHAIQSVHWRKLPYWVLAPAALALAGSVALVWYRPTESPAWAVWCALGCQLAAHALTAVLWGRWQAKLSKDPLGSKSVHLTKITSTHWIRTSLVTAYGLVLYVWGMQTLAQR